jgi:hypothetical protein
MEKGERKSFKRYRKSLFGSSEEFTGKKKGGEKALKIPEETGRSQREPGRSEQANKDNG